MLTVDEVRDGINQGLLTPRQVFAVMHEHLVNYKELASERGDFIINGEELGYISTPTSETDKAYHVFMRAKITDESADDSLSGN